MFRIKMAVCNSLSALIKTHQNLSLNKFNTPFYGYYKRVVRLD